MELKRCESLKKYGAEIIFLLYKIHEIALDPVAREYIYQMSCKATFGNGDRREQPAVNFVCHDGDSQKMAVLYTVIYRNIYYIPTIVLGLMVGSWSDRPGRKIPLVIGCIGMALGSLCFVLSTSSWIPTIIVFFLGCSIRGLFCACSLTGMIIYSYIADTTKHTERTTRMRNLLAVNFCGLFLGSILAGITLEIGDFSTIFSVKAVLMSVYAVSTLLLLPYDKPTPSVNDSKNSQNSCTLNHIKGTLYCLVRKRNGNGRQCVLASLCTLML